MRVEISCGHVVGSGGAARRTSGVRSFAAMYPRAASQTRPCAGSLPSMSATTWTAQRCACEYRRDLRDRACERLQRGRRVACGGAGVLGQARRASRICGRDVTDARRTALPRERREDPARGVGSARLARSRVSRDRVVSRLEFAQAATALRDPSIDRRVGDAPAARRSRGIETRAPSSTAPGDPGT